MDDPRPPAPGDEPGEIADAASLFHDDPGPAGRANPASPAAGPTASPAESYDLDEAHRPAPAGRPAPPLSPTDPVPPRPPPLPAAVPTAAARKPSREPAEAVDEVWSRTGEWAGSVLLLVAVGCGLVVLLYVLVSAEAYGIAFLALMAGGLAMVVLSYPILITLERPVRMTPEQAARDYYAALSHHAPHYRRMWLLLSREGRLSPSFASFEGFKAYWKTRLAELRGGRASGWTPLKFQVDDFRSEKSAGKTEVEATFVVKVIVRGQTAAGPVETVRVTSTFIKGPDRMWYLDRGILP